ncbi:hypothetical protein RJ640_001657 [Escallonia rubra]|uniref:Uncharacterized protein n=1 Tax=Escallonia rubra TaxID=112253 RepID=A0AA88UMS5_9ASTE|nr:hypothetical protein RJ640_001657 [Escallonia rubra]
MNLLPAAILALVSILSLQDREVLAYMITRSMKSTNPATVSDEKKKTQKKSGMPHKPSVFDCECFGNYTSYWFRWDSSPNHKLIHQAIEAFEDHLSNGEFADTTSPDGKPGAAAVSQPENNVIEVARRKKMLVRRRKMLRRKWRCSANMSTHYNEDDTFSSEEGIDANNVEASHTYMDKTPIAQRSRYKTFLRAFDLPKGKEILALQRECDAQRLGRCIAKSATGCSTFAREQVGSDFEPDERLLERAGWALNAWLSMHLGANTPKCMHGVSPMNFIREFLGEEERNLASKQ